MAATTEIAARIEASRRDLAAEVAFLPDMSKAWDSEPQHSRLNFLMEWNELMDRLIGLDRACRGNPMTNAQEDRHRALLDEIARTQPIVRHLGLRSIPASLARPRPHGRAS